jgi:hypothetical protein
MAALRQELGPRQFAAREVELGPGPLHLGLGQGAGRFGRLHAGSLLGFGAQVQERGVLRQDRGQHRLAGFHQVAHLALDPR